MQTNLPPNPCTFDWRTREACIFVLYLSDASLPCPSASLLLLQNPISFFLLQPPWASMVSTVCFVAAVELLLCSGVVPAATTWVSCLEHMLDA